MIEHCISVLSERNETDRYREYIAEGLRVISENLSAVTKISYISKSYDEFVKRKPKVQKQAEPEQKTGDATERIRAKFR